MYKRQTYTAWTTDEVISLREYLQYAISMNWIDVTKISGDDPYLDSQEIYQLVLEYIQSALMEDMEFGKMLYKYMLLDDQMTGREVCLLLYDQGVLEYDEDVYKRQGWSEDGGGGCGPVPDWKRGLRIVENWRILREVKDLFSIQVLRFVL